jgi:uncharacterized membrane protein
MPKWLLPASIIVNAFLVGAVVAHLYADPRPPGPRQAMNRLMDDLPPADRDLLEDAFASSFETMDVSRRAMSEIDRKLRSVLETEPFDKAAFRSLLEQSDALHAQFPHALTALLPDVVEKMSPDGRKKMAQLHFLGGPPPGPPPGMP